MRKVIALALALAFALPLAALAPTAAAQTPQVVVPVTEVTSWVSNGSIDEVSYSPDGKHLALAVDGGPVQILNSTTFAVEYNFTTSANWYSVSSLSWGPNSDKVGVGYEGGAVAVWRLGPASTPTWSKPNLNYDVRGVAWSPDGKFLAAGIVHSVLIYWYTDGYLNATIPLDYGGSQPAGLSWSHDSDFIAVGQQALSPSGAIVALFDAKSWGKSLGWRWSGEEMDNVAFEGRGRFLAVQLGHTRAEVWEVRNWSLFANLSTTSGIEQFAWTSDGTRMVTLETEPSARPNQTEDFGGFELLHLGGGAGNSSALGVSPDGRTVAVGYADGLVRILSVGGERLFEDLTPLTGTTGDPLTFSVRSTGPGTVHVDYTDRLGGHPGSADLVAVGGTHTVTITVPSDWEGTMLYTLSQPANGITAPQRIVRISDNDAPTVTTWSFTRTGTRGEFGTAAATVSDNVRVDTCSMLLAIDGAAGAAATAGGNQTLSFSLTAGIAEENETVRIEIRGTDASNNGGSLLSMVIDLEDLGKPQFGADLSEAGTAGGRILLGTIALDSRGPPTVRVTWRELTVDSEGPWSNFTYGTPAPLSNSFSTTFAVSRNAVAVEYAFNATDAAGNSVETEVRVVPVLDLEPPELVADLSDRQAAQGDTFHLGLITRDNIGVTGVVAQVQEDGGATVDVVMTPWPEYGEGAFEANITVGAEAQLVAYEFVITDTEGNSVSSGRRQLKVLDNDPPSIRIIEAVLRATAGGDYTFHVETADRSDVRNLTVFYRRAGEANYLQEEFTPDSRGGTVVRTARFGISLSELGIATLHDGRAIEVYFYTIDGALNGGTLGSPAAPVVIEVLDGGPPVAHIGVAGDYTAGSSVSFDGSASDDDLGVVEYAWTIDDQPAGNRSAIAWQVDSAGQHTIKLTVKDAAGNAQTQTLRFTANAPVVQGAPVGNTVIWIVVGAAIAGAGVLLFMRMRQPKKPEGDEGQSPPGP